MYNNTVVEVNITVCACCYTYIHVDCTRTKGIGGNYSEK